MSTFCPLFNISERSRVLDKNHGLARNLFDCVIWNSVRANNLSAPYAPGIAVNTASAAVSMEGKATFSNGGTSTTGPYWQFSDHGNLAAGDLTIRHRFQFVNSSVNNYCTIFDKGYDGEISLRLYQGGIWKIAIGGGTAFPAYSGGNLTVGLVYEVVVTRIASTVTIYLNGVSNVTTTLSGTLGSAGSPLRFGPCMDSGDANTQGLGMYNLVSQTWLRGLSAAEVNNLWFNPYGFLRSDTETIALMQAPQITSVGVGLRPGILFRPGSGPTKNIRTKKAYPVSSSVLSISASKGTYLLTGQTQTLSSSRSISASEGTYTLTGETTTLGVGMPASQGSYTLTGQAVIPGVGMSASQGTYTLTGKPQAFQVALSTKPQQGTYTLTGNPQVLTKTTPGTGSPSSHRFIADTGNLTSQVS